MMIMKFHRLIQSRLLWLIFLGVIVVSFVFWGAAETGADPAAARDLQRAIARVNGETITFQQFDKARRQIARNLERRLPPEELDQRVYTHFAMISNAEKIGLRIPRIVAEQRYAGMLVDEDGVVDEEFRAEVLQSLRRDRLTEADIIEFIRGELLTRELQRILSTLAPAPSFDAKRWASLQTDVFSLDYAEISPDLAPDLPELTEEELAAFFEENLDEFTLPEKRSVRYLRLAVEEFTREDDRISEAEARAIYDANPDRYAQHVPVETEDGGMEFQQQTREFEEVKDIIIENARMNAARNRAAEEAMSLSVRLTPRRGRPAPTMDDLAEEHNLELHHAGPFHEREQIEGTTNPQRFTAAAFELDQTPIGRTSQPVETRNAVYVLQLDELLPPRPPELDEVREKVREEAIARRERQAMQEFSDQIHDDLTTLLADGVSFQEAARELGLTPESSDPYQLKDLATNVPGAPPMALAEAATAKAEGELVGPLHDPRTGRRLIGQVTSRQPHPEDQQEMQTEIQPFLENQFHLQSFFERYDNHVLQRNLEVLAPDRADPDSDEI